MSKFEIIEDLAKNKVVENIARKICKSHPNFFDDMVADTYLSLLEKDEDFILCLYNKGEFEYYIGGIIHNSFYSKTSPTYKNYRKFSNLSRPLTNECDEIKYKTDD